MSEPTKDSVEYIANKFAENPGHFAAKILRMYWDVEKQRDQFKSERDTLIDDLSRYKAKVSKLERDNEKLQGRLDEFLEHDYDNQKLYKENHNLLSEFSQHVGNKPSSSTYKYFRGKLDSIGIRESE